MPMLRILGSGRQKLRRTFTFGDQSFLTLTKNRVNARVDDFRGPKAPHNVQYTRYLDEPGWVKIEARQGDRPFGDSLLVDRVGMDGWIDPFANGDRRFHIKFSIVFGPGCAGTPNNWLNFFELHAFKLPGIAEYEGSGPIRLSWEWSFGSNRPIFRVYNQLQNYDPNGIAIGATQAIVYEASTLVNPQHNLVEGQRYEFEIDIYSNDSDGFVHIKKDGDLIVNINNQRIGYGVERRHYPQFRIYRATRSNVATLFVKPLEITSPRIPDLPGVTRGSELIRDGRFPINKGVWSDLDSDPSCGMNWESDGAGGGLLRSFTTGGSTEFDPKARIKRRLDILEVGETYELRHSGTFGIGAAPTDGGYFVPSLRYLIPAFNNDGSEIVRQFVANSETIFIGGSNPLNGRTVDSISLKRVILS